MTIARIPKRNATDIQSEDAFIEGKGMVAGADRPANKTSIMLRVDPVLLDEITREAKAAGLRVRHKISEATVKCILLTLLVNQWKASAIIL